MECYDRDGRALSLEEWARLSSDRTYARIAYTQVGHLEVSTVWLGIDHGFGWTERPLIFETMILGATDSEDDYQARWSTEQEALDGHSEAAPLPAYSQPVPSSRRHMRVPFQATHCVTFGSKGDSDRSSTIRRCFGMA